MSSELVLHLPLNGFEVERDPESGQARQIVKDVSGRKNHGEILGAVAVIEDEYFGACASFDGSPENYISIKSNASLKIAGNVTAAAWVYIANGGTDWVSIFNRGASFGLWYIHVDDVNNKSKGTRWLLRRGDTTIYTMGGGNCSLQDPQSTTLAWYHVAGVVSEKRASLYVHDAEGRLVAKVSDSIVGTPIDNDEPLTIGCVPGRFLPHSGRLAHVRIYNGARTLEEIEGDIAQDRLSLVGFRRSHPIEFRLYDDDDQSVLYINDDPAAHPHLHMELHNTSTQSIQFSSGESGLNTPASPTNHHFAVRFRPGTLSDSTLTWLIDPAKRITNLQSVEHPTDHSTDQWDLYFPPTKPAANQAAVLYLLYKGPKTLFEPNDRVQLVLAEMTAAPGNGARGTLVELIPRQLTAVGDPTPITGTRTQYVHITNHTGRKNIPLHLWFDGGNTVLNDGSPTTLNLCIGNGSDKANITLDRNSRFSLSFDVGGDEDAGWTLTTPANAEAVKVITATNDFRIEAGNARGQSANTVRHWDLIPGERVLYKRGGDSHNHLNLFIDNILVHPNKVGHANLYVQYTNIPGYQDGQFILTVEKSPLVYTTDGGVRIGGVDVGQSLITLANEIKAIHENKLLEHNFNVTVLPNKFGKLTFAAGNEPRGLLFGNKAMFTGTFGLTGSNPYDIATRSETVHSTNPWLRLDGSLPQDLSIFDAAKKKLRHELQAELERQYEKLRAELQTTAWLLLNFRPKNDRRGEIVCDPIRPPIAGFYYYDIGDMSSRRMQLREDGTVGEGSGKYEQRWKSSPTKEGAWQITLLDGNQNSVCTCNEDSEGVFRGNWEVENFKGLSLTPEVKPIAIAATCEWTLDTHGRLTLTFNDALFRRFYALRYDDLPDPNITQIASIMFDHNPVPTWSLSYDNGCIAPLLPEPYSIAIDLSSITYDIR